MATTTSQSLDAYRQAFKRFNKFMLLMWRLGLRRWINAWPGVIGRIMVLSHTGRVTGMRRQTPVNYAQIDGALYCTVGYGLGSDWYRNILTNPNVEVWLPDSRWAGLAQDFSKNENRIPLLREVLIASGFAAPMFGINPRSLDDQGLADATQDYRLIHIQLTHPLSGPGGPGDLAWVWIPIIMAALIYAVNRKYAMRDTRQ